MFDMFRTQASPKELRPHQVKALDLIRASAKAKNRRIVCQMPTGAGKTVTAAKLILSALGKGKSAIFTAPAISLIDQTVTAFEAEGIPDIGVMQANHPRTNSLARVQVASVQTLAQRDIPPASLVIVDECHMGFDVVHRLMDERPDAFFVGMSATPWAQGMGRRWQDLVTPVTIAELIEAGFLSRFTAFAPDVPDLSGVKVRAGEYVESGLEAVMGDAKLMGNVVATWLERGEDRPTLCFAVNRAHAAGLAGEFQRQGIASAYVDALTDMAERSYINARFRAGEIRVICSVRTMTTGVDLPVSCIIDAAPTKSEMLHVQKIGRGLRVNPGTEDCLILDHAGNSIRLGLVTDIHHTSLNRQAKGEKAERKPAAEKLPTPCVACGVLHVGKVCPSCGHERKPVANIETAQGELVQLTGKRRVPTSAEKQAFWAMCKWMQAQRGWSDGRTANFYRNKFGVWPRGLSNTAVTPDPVFFNYEKAERVKYAKRMEAQQKARGV
jgi:DNA repair protein RadD